MIKSLIDKLKSPNHPEILTIYFLTTIFLSLGYLYNSSSLLNITNNTHSLNNRLLLTGYAFFYIFFLGLLLFLLSKSIFFILKRLLPRLNSATYKLFTLFPLSLLILLTYIDQKLYTLLGIHISSPLLIETLPRLKQEADIGIIHYIISGISLLILTTILYFFASKIGRKLSNINLSVYLIIGGALLGIKTTIPDHDSKLETIWIYTLSKTNFYYKTVDVAYNPPQNITLKRKKNILIIVAESLNYKIFQADIFPNITRFIKQNQCIISSQHYSSSHTTFNSIHSIIYSLFSYHRIPFENRKQDYITSFPIQILRKNDYKIYGGFSSQLTFGEQFIKKNFDQSQKFESLDTTYENDQALIDWVEKIYKDQKENNALYFLFLNSTHFSYNYPKKYEKFKPVMERLSISTDAISSQRKLLFNRYKNSAYFVDTLFKQLLDIFKKDIDQDKLIIVFTGDHGEEFWEFGQFGHAGVGFHNPRVQVPFILCMPEITAKKVALSSHTDIFPTIFDYLKISPSHTIKEYTNGVSLLTNPLPDRYIIVTGHGFPFFDKRAALISTHGKLLLKRLSRSFDQINRFLITRITDIADQELKVISPELKQQLNHFQKLEFSRFFKRKK